MSMKNKSQTAQAFQPAEFGYGHAIDIMFFHDRRLLESFPSFWDRMDKGWKHTFPLKVMSAIRKCTCLVVRQTGEWFIMTL